MPWSRRSLEFASWKPTVPVSIAIFLLATGGMAYLRLLLYADRFVTLTYALPLLLCIWYPSRRLLWSMAVTFIAMAAYKAFVLYPHQTPTGEGHIVQWLMQVANILIVCVAVHVVLVVLDRLRATNVSLEQSNEELKARDEEISRQNAELQAQTEELAQQNEEIQQQSEELQVQAEELHMINAELGQRQDLLEKLLRSLHDLDAEHNSPGQLIGPLLQLFRGNAVAALIVLRDGDDVVADARSEGLVLQAPRWPYASSFAAVAMEQEKVAGVADLALRPDFIVARPAEGSFRAILAAPVRTGGQPVGAIEVYSDQPHAWTREQFNILEWAATQCSLIMEVRRLQKQLVAANAGLDRLVKARTAELQELVNELEHFSYTITHDLRAPLRAMHGFAEFLEEESGPSLNDQSREYLRRIGVAARRMDQLINDALNYSKAMRLELAMTATDPGRLLRGMIESYPAFQPPRSQIELPDHLPPVLANEAALTQCFSNLLDNAVKFVPPGRTPHVRVRAEDRDGMIRLWFEDNGIGIPRELHPRLFTMFQRLSKDYEGTGIGLALVRKVAERMGGRVGVESEAGQGSRFWLELKRGN